MNNKKYILDKIREKRDRCYRAPKWGMPKRYFEQLSYHNWAVEELIKEIEESETLPPMIVVEEFINRMEEYACKSEKNGRMFSIAKDAGEWVLDILISLN